MHEMYPGCWVIRSQKLPVDINIESRDYQETQMTQAMTAGGPNDKKEEGPYHCIRSTDGNIHIHRAGDTLPPEDVIIDTIEQAWTLTGVGVQEADLPDMEEGWSRW